MSRPAPLRPEDPLRLGPYRLAGRLGQGGQGVVFLAGSADHPRVAVKLLHARLLDDEKVRRRFIGEIEAVRRVAPFCTAQVLDADLDGARPYIVSEFVDGVSLQEHVVAEGPRADGSLARVAVGTATALAAIHRAGVVHRDFKPGNVLLGMDGPRVIDFGISRMMDAATTTGKIPFGTPAYMSPEQIKGEPAGPPADMFSWALTVAFTATGRHAFSADSYHAVLARILYGKPDLGLLAGPLREIVVACMAVDPAARPVAEEVLHRLYGRTAAVSRPDSTATAGVTTVELPAVDLSTTEFPAAGLPAAESSATDPRLGRRWLPGTARTHRRRPEAGRWFPEAAGSGGRWFPEAGVWRRWFPAMTAGVVLVAVVAGTIAFLSRDDLPAGGPYPGTWTGVADYTGAERVFPVEVRFAAGGGGGIMRWGADLHCDARLTATGPGLAYRLDRIQGRQCYPGTVVFSRRTADRLAFEVTRSGERAPRYSGEVIRSR